MLRKIVQIVAGAAGLFVLLVLAIGLIAGKRDASNNPTRPAPADRAQPALPADQQTFIGIVARFARAYDAAPNDMARGGTRPDRGRALCAAHRQPAVADWQGTLTKISSNSDGHGVLSVAIGQSITVQTWNNDFSDMSDHTLIPHGSPLFAAAVALREGQRVRFSGAFFPDPLDCFRELSLSVNGSMTEPEYLFRFSEIKPAD